MNSPTSAISLPPAATAPAGHAVHAAGRPIGSIGDILNNPMQLRMLADRVYALLVEDLRLQSERVGNYGARFRR